jgi:protein TonB
MFESALSTQKSQNRRRWIALPAAVGLHLTALVAFVSADYWHIRPVTEPDESAVFVMVTPPPPMAIAASSGANRPKQPTPVKEPVKPPQGPVQPEDVKDLTPPPATPADANQGGDGTSDNGDPEGSKNGREDGVKNGSDEGVIPVLVAPPIGDPAPTGPIHITARVKKPEILHRVSPAYPESARRARVQGAVILEAIIDERGNVTSVRVVRGLPMGLEQSAIQAVSQWKFQPAMLDNRPVAVYFSLTVQFEVR